MHHKALLVILLTICSLNAKSQSIYADVTTTAAILLASETLSDRQKEHIEQSEKLQELQGFVSLQMERANNIQNKLYKGLSEVSGTLENAIQVKYIWANIKRCQKKTQRIGELVKKHPQYSIFGIKATQTTREHIVECTTKMSQILSSGELNLATSGDRYRLLEEINYDLRMLNIYLLSIQLALERADRLGFWKSLNPFQGYINTDKNIV